MLGVKTQKKRRIKFNKIWYARMLERSAATRATADIQNGKAVIEKSSILTTEIRLV